MKKCLIIDNYDSFTDNLRHLLEKVNPQIEFTVLRNSDNTIFNFKCDYLVISPGPMRPENSGNLSHYFSNFIIPNKIPVFGVCLGMQFIAHYYGATVTKAEVASHGSTEQIEILDNSKLFRNIKKGFLGARYNSLEVGESEELSTLAIGENSMIMALEHKKLPFVGVQFHPESFLTEYGEDIIQNFFKYYV